MSAPTAEDKDPEIERYSALLARAKANAALAAQERAAATTQHQAPAPSSTGGSSSGGTLMWVVVLGLGAAAAWMTLNPENRARHRRSGEPLIELPWSDGYWEDPDR